MGWLIFPFVVLLAFIIGVVVLFSLRVAMQYERAVVFRLGR